MPACEWALNIAPGQIYSIPAGQSPARSPQRLNRPPAAPVDPLIKALYIAAVAGAGRYLLNEIRMCANESENTGLEALEARVDALIDILDQLKSENTALRTERAGLRQECAMLIEKNEQAEARIKSIIARLSALEIRA